MGVFDRFERRIERAVEGTFAKVFKDEAEPADIARALQRESDDRHVIVAQGHLMAPNHFTVALGDHDHARLAPYAAPLGDAFGEMIEEHARERGYSFAGPVQVDLRHDAGLDTGRFKVSSESTQGGDPSSAPRATPSSMDPEPAARTSVFSAPGLRHRHQLVVSHQGSVEAGTPAARGEETVIPLDQRVLLVGRSVSADLQLEDPGVSRRHAEFTVVDDVGRLTDLDSTNGTSVNGVTITAPVELNGGDRIQLGSTILIYRRLD